MIPQSWADLHLPKWKRIARSTSELEMFWYQNFLIDVVISLCDLVKHIERRVLVRPVGLETLVRRAVTMLVISLVNLGTSSPLPIGYGQVWIEVQKVRYVLVN